MTSPTQRRTAAKAAVDVRVKEAKARVAARKLAHDEDRPHEVDDRRDPLQVDPSVERKV
jgi:hypothetical protein